MRFLFGHLHQLKRIILSTFSHKTFSHEPIAIFNKIRINFMNFPQVHKTFSLCVIYQTGQLCAVGFGLSALDACTIVYSIAI